MRLKRPTKMLAELRESFAMAMNAIAAHKLRSALTLLGVLIGVFSIIVVMTAVRVLKNNIEQQLASLGTDTFMVRKWPGVYFGNGGDLEKYWRRKNVDLLQGKKFQARATLPAAVGIETGFWSGGIATRYKTSAPTVRVLGETPGSFSAHDWDLADGRVLLDVDVDSARNSWTSSALNTRLFSQKVCLPARSESLVILKCS